MRIRFTRLIVAVSIALAVTNASAFDLEGHRGARGLAPENTLAAFKQALAIGVTTIETDLAATRDDVLVISHDPFLNPDLAHAARCAIWSPLARNVTATSIAESHALGLKVLPWTVNDPAEMARLIDAGVDGIITDYPDRLRRVMAEKTLALP